MCMKRPMAQEPYAGVVNFAAARRRHRDSILLQALSPEKRELVQRVMQQQPTLSVEQATDALTDEWM